MSAWGWLVANGFLRDLIAAAVGTIVAHIFAWRPWKRHVQRQQKIIDLLDTGKPGGLTDVVAAAGKRPEGEAAK